MMTVIELPLANAACARTTVGEIALAFEVDEQDVIACIGPVEMRGETYLYCAQEARREQDAIQARSAKRAAIRRRRERQRAAVQGQPVGPIRKDVIAGLSNRLLYAFHNPDSGLTKIGVTDRLLRRLDDLENACGSRLVVLHHVLGKRDVIEMRELLLHEQWDAQRMVGEWFRLSDNQRATLPAFMEGRL